jgi:hypothetical protein
MRMMTGTRTHQKHQRKAYCDEMLEFRIIHRGRGRLVSARSVLFQASVHGLYIMERERGADNIPRKDTEFIRGR